jgi:hypothetical protein
MRWATANGNVHVERFQTEERIVANPTGFWRYRPYRDLFARRRVTATSKSRDRTRNAATESSSSETAAAG